MPSETDPVMFVLAPPTALPDNACSVEELVEAQQHGPHGGSALRLFSVEHNRDLALGSLSTDGQFNALQRELLGVNQVICDAVVPYFEPQQQWMGVYQQVGDSAALLCLDRFPLAEANNQTCWFYPTQNGSYLSWERELRLTMEPGRMAASARTIPLGSYQREHVAVLWSLLADDEGLTCVGLTYKGQRIDWPMPVIRPEPMATWGRFRVDNQADVTLVVETCQTVFSTPQAED